MPLIGWVLIVVAAASIIGVVIVIARHEHEHEEWFRPGHPHWDAAHQTAPSTPAAPVAPTITAEEEKPAE